MQTGVGLAASFLAPSLQLGSVMAIVCSVTVLSVLNRTY